MAKVKLAASSASLNNVIKLASHRAIKMVVTYYLVHHLQRRELLRIGVIKVWYPVIVSSRGLFICLCADVITPRVRWTQKSQGTRLTSIFYINLITMRTNISRYVCVV